MSGIYVGTSPLKSAYVGTTPVKAIYVGTTKVRPSGPDKDYLCFTAKQANSTVKLSKTGSPTSVNLETSTDGTTWSNYTIGNTITLSSVGSKVYWRNKSTTATEFSTSSQNYYRFIMTGSIAGSGDINFLLCKNGTNTVSKHCYFKLFYDATSLVSCPKLTATTINGSNNYMYMFSGCTNLTTVPKLPATGLKNYCYSQMFAGCSKIGLSASQTSDYTKAYRIPTSGTGTSATDWNYRMFYQTLGQTVAPAMNKTYYLHKDNTIVG